MAFGLSQDWEIHSAGGSTGNAFIASHSQEKIFIKRNTSPFLAALSAEGITPKLLWTKRMPNGDVITAQQWVAGTTLTAEQMNGPKTAALLAKVHSSNLLKGMLEKMGGSFVTADQMLVQLEQTLPDQLRYLPSIIKGITWLEDHTLQVPVTEYRVCHGDLNKKNWLETVNDTLFLVDWDQAILTDPAYDLTTVLINYVPRSSWTRWLADYGQQLDTDLIGRIRWYSILQEIISIIQQTTNLTNLREEMSRLDQLIDR
ncbi:phosphotransferase [Agrilactobacillus fermenti]|uniref:phosphotransferase family protein n=1 Tax=Agrilactobacillus fermenti TaxID=2586909 RepID=UPI001E433C98|nr:phosphotransferase family protein [Agrilactobacillus fermenti]MCD2256649.1 phosphotransferase family protein [Agrilactobacillus fermenti]